MPEFKNQVFDWIEQVGGQDRQIRIEAIRLEIGTAFIDKYTRLREELDLTEAALTKLGLASTEEKTKDTYITAQQYEQVRQELGGYKGLWSRLWDSTKRQSIVQQRWPELFDQAGRMNVNELAGLVSRQELTAPKIGERSRWLAQRLVDHLLSDQDIKS